MDTSILNKPSMTETLTMDELQNAVNLPLWDRLNAACYLLGEKPLNIDEFQANPPNYQITLEGLLTSAFTDEDKALLKEFQRYQTRYPDIEYLYNALGKLSKPRLSGVYINDKTNVIESAEPMAWIKLAKENSLYVGPGIDEVWIKHLLRSKKRYFPPKTNTCEQPEKINPNKKKETSVRPLHEPGDIDNIQHLGRKIFRENPLLNKEKIAIMIREIYPRAAFYNLRVVIKWLRWANIALANRGRPKKSSTNA